MGLFDFSTDSGTNVLDDEQQQNSSDVIRQEIENNFEELPIDGLIVEVNGDSVTLAGVTKDFETRERAISIAGNTQGVSYVNADQLVVQDEFTQEEIEIPEEIFYTIEEGDTLWAIAKKFYGDGTKYSYIVEANSDIIENENLIYAGQTIRIPNLENS